MPKSPNNGSSTATLRDHAQTVLDEQERQAAMAAENASAEAPAAAIEAEADAVGAYLTDATGIRVDQALVMPALLPVPRADAVDWIMRNVVAQGRGTHVNVGRVVGQAIRAEWKETEWQGKTLRSVLLTGEFRMQSTLTELVRENAELWLPVGYAKAIAAKLALYPDAAAMFDVDVGIEATGRTIPYAWTVVSHLRQRSSDALERLWTARKAAPSLLAAPSAPPHAA